MPETMVAKTSGAMIILISRRKMSVTTVKFAATAFASSGPPASWLQREADRDPEDDAEPIHRRQPTFLRRMRVLHLDFLLVLF